MERWEVTGDPPERARDDLGPFARRLAFGTPDGPSSSRDIRSDSPVSVDSGSHASDRDFIDDTVNTDDEDE